MRDYRTKITCLESNLVHRGMEVNDFAHDRPEYSHAIMCQLGLPRSRQAERTDNGVKLYWKSLRDQLGKEYKNPKGFKKAFAPEMRKVLTVYPIANVRQEYGGMRLSSSPAPIRKTRMVARLPTT